MRTRTLPLAALLAAAAALPAAAQKPARSAAAASAPPSERALMIEDWERDRDNVLAYTAAMPDSAVAFRATPGVRSFAEQIQHLVSTHVEVAAQTLRGTRDLPALGDTARYLRDRAALVAYVRASYDYVIAAIRAATPAQLARVSSLYGQPPATTARWLQLSREHSAWTLGQTVPYLRLNRVTPPSYKLPF